MATAADKRLQKFLTKEKAPSKRLKGLVRGLETVDTTTQQQFLTEHRDEVRRAPAPRCASARAWLPHHAGNLPQPRCGARDPRAPCRGGAC